MFVISPFSTGGWVASDVFDHTSTIRFMEVLFGVEEPNISAWRRQTCGDLTTALRLKPGKARSFPALPGVRFTRKTAGRPWMGRPAVSLVLPGASA